MNPARLWTWVAALALATPAAAAAASDLGKVDFPTSAKSQAAQAHFVRGVAALHNFWYDEAADAFREAQKAEPGFAMAYWGEALTYDHPIWDEQDREAALQSLARLAPTAQERAAKAPVAREKDWLAAVEVLYGEGEKAARHAAYSEAMRRLHERYPDDLEAASFYALSLIGPALSGEVGDRRERDLIRAAALLEELFDKNPEHPGVLHYLIHAYDDPLHAPLGLRAARLYARVAPAAHHALHMPSHIFVQLGDWERTAASNEAAWAASVAWVERRAHPLEKRDFHSLSWLLYAYLQQGRRGKAREVLEIARRAAEESDSPRVASARDGMEARYRVETSSWDEAKAPPPAADAPAADDPSHAHGQTSGRGDAALWLARGIAAARQGDSAAAEEAAGHLPQGVMKKEVSALALLAGGRRDEALALLAEAAEDEAKTPAPMGPPETIKPAQELYGEVLLALERPEEAKRQFEKALLRMPNRTASLLGAARAAARLGDDVSARRYYGTLADIWRQADAGIPEVEEARKYLEKEPVR